MSARALKPQATRAVETIDGQSIPARTELAAGCPLGDIERAMLACVDGARTIRELSELLGLTTREGAMVLTRLAELGAVSLSQPLELDAGWDAPSGTMPTVRPARS